MYVYTFDDMSNSQTILKLFTLPEEKAMLSQKHDDARSFDVLFSLS